MVDALMEQPNTNRPEYRVQRRQDAAPAMMRNTPRVLYNAVEPLTNTMLGM